MASLFVKDAVVGEGDGYVDIVVTLDAPSAQVVTVRYDTANGSAQEYYDNDYVQAGGTLSFAAGETSKTVRVTLPADTQAEEWESFFLRLSNPVNATIGDAIGMVSILDNDTVVQTPSIFVRDVIVDEKQGTAVFAVTLGPLRGQASNSTVTVNYATQDGTAAAGSDYTARSGSLTFAPGEVVKTVAVSLLDDSTLEGLERFGLVLSNPVNATLGDGFALAEIMHSDRTATTQPRLSIGDAVVGEGDTYVDLAVTLSAPGQNTVSVRYATGNSTAQEYYDDDYIESNATLTFLPGEAVKTVRIEIPNDRTAEGFESFFVRLSSPVNASIADGVAMINIVDNDTAVDTPSVYVRDRVVDEKQGTVSFVVTLGDLRGTASNSTVTVDFATQDGTAAAGSDYVARSGTLSFAPGETAKAVVVDLIDDSAAEALERFSLVLSNAVNATLGVPSALAEMAANDATATAQPRIAVADAVIGEGDTYVDLVVSLSAPGQNEVTVEYDTGNSTAQEYYDDDYIASSNVVLTFLPGETVKTARIEIPNDLTPEGFESFFLRLSKPVNATITDGVAMINIIDNDTAVDTPGLFVRDLVVDEKQGTATFTVTLGNLLGQASNSVVTVNYTTQDGTAAAGSDFVGRSGVLSFAPGEVARKVVIDLIDDNAAEALERFSLVLSSPVNAVLGDGVALAEIAANDSTAVSQPRLSVADRVIGEGDTYVDLVIALSAPGQNTVTVEYDTGNSTAQEYYDDDYIAASNVVLTFLPGETVKTVRLEIPNDQTAENFESFFLRLSGATNATISDGVAMINIVDNDTVVDTPGVFVRDVVVDERQGTASFVVTLGNLLGRSSNSTVTVNYTTQDGTAAAGSDYLAKSGTLSFAPGETVKTIVIDLIDDSATEPLERFSLLLSNPAGATIGDGAAVAEITANDSTAAAQPRISIGDAVIGEGDAYVDLVVSLSAPGQNAVTVAWATDDASAQNYYDDDFIAASGTLTFLPGETSKTVRLEIPNDLAPEGFESLFVRLSSPTSATLADALALVQIIDNDSAVDTPEVYVHGATVDEKSGVASFVVSLGQTVGQASNSRTQVDFRTSDGSARAGWDFVAKSGTLVFEPGETAKTITVDITDDSRREGAESFGFVLSNPVGLRIVDGAGAATIGASDQVTAAQPLVSVGSVDVSEGAGYVELPVTLNNPSASAVAVNYTTRNGTAASGSDFGAYSGTLSFAPGQTTAVLRIEIVESSAEESIENFTVVLSAPVNAALGSSTGTVQIFDNDAAGVAVLGYGLGDDVYRDVTASTRIVELPGGGRDTIVVSATTTLPEQIENAVLTGSGAGNLTGNALANVLRGNAGDNRLDGQGGIDTAVFAGHYAAYALQGGGGSFTVSGGGDGRDTLVSIERLQFADMLRADDTAPGGNTYAAYALLNAAFDRAPSSADLGRWTAQLDLLGSPVLLAQAMIDSYAPGVPNDVLVAYLWGTVVEAPIGAADLASFVGLIESGTYTQASLLELASTHPLNTNEFVHIVGSTQILDPSYFAIPG